MNITIVDRSNPPDERWVFEPGEPGVGIFGDLILHECEANTDEDDADEGECVRVWFEAINIIAHVVTYRCPVCGATWERLDEEPIEMGEES